jgi:agmatinase
LASGGVRIERRSKRIGAATLAVLGTAAARLRSFVMERKAPGTVDTFLTVAACDVSHLSERVDVVIVGAPDGTPHPPGEASHATDAPDAMRRSIKAAASDLTRWDFDQNGPLLVGDLTVRDAGNIATNPANPGRNRELIRAATRAILDVSAVPVLLGGDDSVPIPFFEAFETHGPITIVQIDAHLDWRDERNGMRHSFSSPMRRASEMPWVERIVQVGMRGIGASRKGDLDDALRWGGTDHSGLQCAPAWYGAGSRLHSGRRTLRRNNRL